MDHWRPQDLVLERPTRVAQLGQQLGEPRGWVDLVVRDLRFVIDRFVCDDVTVVAPPFLVRRQGDPVWVTLRDLPDEVWSSITSFDDEHLATVLGLDLALVRQHPVVGEADLLWDLWELRGHDLDALESGDAAALKAASRERAVVTAWLDDWDLERDHYDVSRVGLERSFQSWLVSDLERLRPFDLPVELEREEHRFADGRRADVLCRATADSPVVRCGDVVVLENKAHMADLAACDQLDAYVRRVEDEVARRGERVHGVLVADGRTLRLQRRLAECRYSYVSLVGLGYRDWLRGSPPATDPGPDVVREGALASDGDQVTVRDRVPVRVKRSATASAGPWTVAGASYARRSQANRALAAHLGAYDPAQWRAAQRRHGLR